MNDFTILLIMVACAVVISPIYIKLRVKVQHEVVEGDKPRSFYTIRRIVKLVGINMILSGTTIVLLILLFLSIKSRTNVHQWSTGEVVLLVLFILNVALMSYGAGTYIASIIAEQYTLNGLKDEKEFKVLNLSTELFHGPISHVLIYTGLQAGFFFAALLEIFQFSIASGLPSTGEYAMLGLFSGIVYGLMQIANNTWRHQLVWMTIIFLTYAGLVGSMGLNISEQRFNMFFLSFNIALILTLLVKLVHHNIVKDVYRYDGLDK